MTSFSCTQTNPNYTLLVSAFIIIHMLLWAVVNTLLHPTVHFDMVEQLLDGRHFSYNEYRHPPLSFWVPAAFFSLFPTNNLLYNLLAQFNLGLALIAVWLLAKRTLNQPATTIAVLLVSTLPLFFIHSAKLNANSIQIATWAWGIYCALLAIETDKLRYWLGLGLCAGLSLLGKYFALTMFLGMAGFFLTTAVGRKKLLSYKPYLALLVFIALIAPHFYDWFNQESSYHAVRRASSLEPNQGRLDALKFFVTTGYSYNLVLLMCATLFVKRNLFLAMLWPRFTKHAPQDVTTTTRKQLLWWCICAPWLLTSAVALIFDLHVSSVWSIPYWTALPVYLLCGEQLQRMQSAPKALIYACVWYLICASLALAVGYTKPTKHDYNIPAVSAAELLEQDWHTQQNERPQWVAGGRVANFIALYIFNGALDYSSDVKPHTLHGRGIIICEAEEQGCLETYFSIDEQETHATKERTIAADRRLFSSTRAITLRYRFVDKGT